MPWLLVAIVVLLLVAFTVFFGPPYLPTLNSQMATALELLDLRPGETLIELGSGDGRVLLAAAKQGINVVGIELSPILVVISWLRTRRYRRNVRIIWGNYFMASWPPADAVYGFMINRQMAKLDHAIERWRGERPVRFASVAFKVPSKQPAVEKNGVHLYVYQ